MTLNTRSQASNQAQKLAAAAAGTISAVDMPALGSTANSAATAALGPRKRPGPVPAERAAAAAAVNQATARVPRNMPAPRIQPKPPTPLFSAATPAVPPPVLPRMPGVRAMMPPMAAAARAAANAKAEKGLRHFSAKVCAKVEEKGCTSYNEVADELVNELGSELGFDSKNIRRRVYDALNVLMAIDVIEKDKKEIRWLGLSNETTNELNGVESELYATQKRIEEKQKALKDLVQRKIAIHGLINRNSRSQNSINAQTLSSTSLLSESNIDGSRADRLYLPFILINAPRDCRVHCEMLEDRTQYFFEFDMSFFINEDIELLRLMGLDNATPDEMRTILPPEIYSYYQTRLKTGLPVNAVSSSEALSALPMAQTPLNSGKRSQAAGGHGPMSSPVRPKHRANSIQPANGSSLRNQVLMMPSSSTTSTAPQSPQPIGQTGIFRKASRPPSSTSTKQPTPHGSPTTHRSSFAANSRENMPALTLNPAAEYDEIARFGLSFSDTLGGVDGHHGDLI